ncbi:MAG: hypothetical protein Q9181_002940 [Wetmoreana brouardii]
MAHRDPRDRGTGRERERERERGVERYDDRRRDAREPVRDQKREFPSSTRGASLNEFFVDGEGIHREVMQRELCKYLGPDALSRPGTYNNMIEDLQMLSQDYEREKREMNSRGYKGSPMRASPSAALPNHSPDLPYAKSRTRERQDAIDPYESDSRFVAQGRYSEMYPEKYPEKYGDKYPENYPDSRMPPGYPMPSGYPPGSGYAPSQAPGYPSSTGYPSAPSYPAGSTYPQGPNYPPTSGYPPSSGYMAPGYTSTSGIPGNRNEPNYTYGELPGEYPPAGYGYQQSSVYPGGSQANPRTAGTFPYVASPQDPALRGVNMDDRGYDIYSQQMVSGQPGRSGFPAPSRGTPTQFDPPQPVDGYSRPEASRVERRRR